MTPIQIQKLFLRWLHELLKDEQMRRFLREQLEAAELPIIKVGRRHRR